MSEIIKIGITIFICAYRNETVASLINKLQKLRNNIDYSSTLHIEVRRSFVVTDALSEARKRRFTPKKLIKVITIFYDNHNYYDCKCDKTCSSLPIILSHMHVHTKVMFGGN